MTSIFLNHYSLFVLYRGGKLFEILDAADRVYIDGQLLVYQLNLILGLNIERKSFDWSSVAASVIEAEEKILFWGGTLEEAKKFKHYIQRELKTTVNAVDGYTTKIEDIIALIDKEDITAVVVGQGSPLQEQQCINITKYLGKKVKLYTCGGFITQTANFNNIYGNGFKYLPRWLVRCIRQPFVIKRLIQIYPLSILLVFALRSNFKTQINKFI